MADPRARGRWTSWCGGSPPHWPTPAYPGAPNGRVRDLPDRRAVRWYATIGLESIDRPAMQGRTALYGVRHLLQIVASNAFRRRAVTLAEIQAELAGATERRCAAIADIPDELESHGASAPPARPAAARSGSGRTAPRHTGRAEALTLSPTLAAVSLPGGAHAAAAGATRRSTTSRRSMRPPGRCSTCWPTAACYTSMKGAPS